MDIVRSNSPRSRKPSARFLLLAVGLIVMGVAALGMRSIDWVLLKQSLRARFAGVQWITPRELATWLADKRRESPLLLDVRTPEEWNVSHLPGARRVDPKSSAKDAAAGVAKETPIVTYCAVGYRSGELAARLQAAGFTRVQNLEGSIFQWANEHRPLMRGKEPVTKVHPYNSFWGRLLAKEVRAPLK